MNLSSRVFLSTIRNPGKTIALLLIVFILGCGISGAISVRQAIQNTDARLRATIPAIATIVVDEYALIEQYVITGERPFPENLTIDTLVEIGALPHVKRYDISAEVSLFSRDLERVGESIDFGVEDWQVINLKGSYTPSLLDVEEGVVEIVSGRTFTEVEAGTLSYVAIISQDLASQNDLGVGSFFTLDNIVWTDEAHETQNFNEESMFAHRSYDFEIIGIFASVAEIDTGNEWADSRIEDKIGNRIYIPNDVAVAATVFQIENLMKLYPNIEWGQEDPEDHILFSNAYVLYDPSEMEAFRGTAQDVLPKFWTIADTGDSFGSIASSMEVLDGFATIILWTAIGAAAIVVSLLILLFLRERKREIGIYLALGERKDKVIAQVMVEILAVSLVAIVVALFAGNVLAAGISEAMLREDMIANQSADGVMTIGVLEQMGAIENMSTDEMLEAYDVSLDTATILIFFVASFATIVVATVMPMLYIVRLNPKKIML